MIDNNLFLDLADTLKVDPAIIEKDFYLVRLLELIMSINNSNNDLDLVFSGGTSIAKCYADLNRMSEDLDLKIVLNDNSLNQSRSKKKNIKKNLSLAIKNLIDKSGEFDISGDPLIRNEYGFQSYDIEYNGTFSSPVSMRPHILLELTEVKLYQLAAPFGVGSIYTKILKLEPEINSIPCSCIETTAAEKLISLLRRTAARERGISSRDDPRLVRHLYDLHFIIYASLNLKIIKEIILKIIEDDREQFRDHVEFINDPIKELRYGYELICYKDIEKYSKRYSDFLDPLIYHPDPPSLEDVLNSLNKFIEAVLPEIFN